MTIQSSNRKQGYAPPTAGYHAHSAAVDDTVDPSVLDTMGDSTPHEEEYIDPFDDNNVCIDTDPTDRPDNDVPFIGTAHINTDSPSQEEVDFS